MHNLAPIDDDADIPTRKFVADCDELKVSKAGDSMSGKLIIDDGLNTPTPGGLIELVRDSFPEIKFTKRKSDPDNSIWRVYVGGGENVSDAPFQIAAADRYSASGKIFVFKRSGELGLGADPTTPLAAATKGYVDTHPGARANITPATGYVEHAAGYGLHATRVGNGLVAWTGQFRPTVAWTSDGYSRLIGTAPVGFWPAQPVVGPGVLVVGSPVTSCYACVMVVNPNGDVRVQLASGIAVPATPSTYFGLNLIGRAA